MASKALGTVITLLAISSSGAMPQDQRHRDTTRSKPGCVCVFDFDLTLRVPRASGNGVNQDGAAAEGLAVIQLCQAVPCSIGMASANRNGQKIQQVLQRNYGTGAFSSAFFKSQAFQFGFGDKSISLRRVADHFGVSTRCMVLFDDAEHNRKYANYLSTHFERVNSKTGVQLWNFYSAMNALPSWCSNGVQREG